MDPATTELLSKFIVKWIRMSVDENVRYSCSMSLVSYECLAITAVLMLVIAIVGSAKSGRAVAVGI
jgi:hypothetical protein